MLKLKLQYFGHLMQRVDSLEKTLMLGRMAARGEGNDQGWDGWMASPTRWIWVWVNSRSCWWTGRPGMLQFIGSQRVRHDWATELNCTEGLGASITSHMSAWMWEQGREKDHFREMTWCEIVLINLQQGDRKTQAHVQALPTGAIWFRAPFFLLLILTFCNCIRNELAVLHSICTLKLPTYLKQINSPITDQLNLNSRDKVETTEF